MLSATTIVTGLTVVLCALYLRNAICSERRSVAIRDAEQSAGLTEPPSLHPVIDPAACLGCGSCVEACPEQNVLGLIDNKAELIGPTHCIGHGACKTACPADAIELVFGTATRGIDIPLVQPNFETNVRGVFIAGELGGMGLIRNAVEQGRQAIDSIRNLNGTGPDSDLDVLIVGAGPAGISASLAAMQHGLRFVTVEQDALGGTVAHYPRGKIVMTAPARLPLAGKMKFGETTKEILLKFWQDVERKTGLEINYHECVEEVQRNGRGFVVNTNRGTYRTRNVLLAIGRRGTPRKLGVPGEDLSKVVYSLTDPEQYRGRHVLVVGGGDSALEAAASLAEEPGTTVALSYRSEAFTRAKEKNRARVQRLSESEKLKVLLGSNVSQILPDSVRLKHRGNPLDLKNEVVIVCAGGILPTPFLENIGITVETKYGTA